MLVLTQEMRQFEWIFLSGSPGNLPARRGDDEQLEQGAFGQCITEHPAGHREEAELNVTIRGKVCLVGNGSLRLPEP